MTFLTFEISYAVVRCQSDVDTSSEVEIDDIGNDGGDDDNQDFGDVVLTSAPGIDTVCVFPQNSALSKHFLHFCDFCLSACNVLSHSWLFNFQFLNAVITAGEETELLVGVNNDGELITTF